MTTLGEEHDALLVDLDGTLFRGGKALPGASAELAAAAETGNRIGYLTNNGSRSAAQVVEHLRELGFAATESEVVTSGQAAGSLLAARLAPDAAVLVVGTDALAEEVTAVGLRVVRLAEEADAVVQGHSVDLTWRLLAEGCLAIRAGALWVACNVDTTLPDERGELPGNGAMVAALVAATNVQPVVAGKPEPAVFHEAVSRSGAERALVVGDRLETDILGAHRAGLPSLLVLTGVTDAATLLAADESCRPTYLGADLEALRADPARLRLAAEPPWQVHRDGDQLVLGCDTASGAAAPDPVAALRALCEVHWAAGGGPADVRAVGDAAVEALGELGLRAPGQQSDRSTSVVSP